MDFVVRQKGQRGEVRNTGAHTNTVLNKTHRLKYIIHYLAHLEMLVSDQRNALLLGKRWIRPRDLRGGIDFRNALIMGTESLTLCLSPNEKQLHMEWREVEEMVEL